MNLLKDLMQHNVERDVDEQLRFHLEQLAESYIDQGMPAAAARDRARERFGNVAAIRRQCVLIGRRRCLLHRLINAMLLAAFIFGVGVRVSSNDLYVGHLGTMLIVVALFGRLWIYLRTLRPVDRASFESIPPTTD